MHTVGVVFWLARRGGVDCVSGLQRSDDPVQSVRLPLCFLALTLYISLSASVPRFSVEYRPGIS